MVGLAASMRREEPRRGEPSDDIPYLTEWRGEMKPRYRRSVVGEQCQDRTRWARRVALRPF
jgi:hypothetical protein